MEEDRVKYFIFAEGSAPGGKTHVFAWDGAEWKLPCRSSLKSRPATYTKPLCKICERCTALLEPLPVRR